MEASGPHDTAPSASEPRRWPPPPPGSAPAAATASDVHRVGRRSAVLSAVVAALISAVVAAGVAFPVARSAVPPEVPQEDAQTDVITGGTSGSVEDDAAPAAASRTADVAAAVSPSVAYVEVVGQAGQGSGSAVIVDADGYLLTNAHVVEGAERIDVTLPDGTSYDAELVGSDPTSDVAVLQLDATGLPALELDADVEVGETVIAIGSPFGLEGSVTSGIVSGLERTLQGARDQTALLGMIQTDAAINPGNSGGALVDLEGRLVGINTAIYSTTGTNSGIGFAIPAATAMSIADQLIESGSVTYAQLGITGGDVTPALAAAYGLAVEEGAVVAEVLPGSGAAEAGIRPGDVIVRLDGEPMTSMAKLAAVVRASDPGETVMLTIDRDGEQLELTVELGSD